MPERERPDEARSVSVAIRFALRKGFIARHLRRSTRATSVFGIKSGVSLSANGADAYQPGSERRPRFSAVEVAGLKARGIPGRSDGPLALDAFCCDDPGASQSLHPRLTLPPRRWRSSSIRFIHTTFNHTPFWPWSGKKAC